MERLKINGPPDGLASAPEKTGSAESQTRRTEARFTVAWELFGGASFQTSSRARDRRGRQ